MKPSGIAVTDSTAFRQISSPLQYGWNFPVHLLDRVPDRVSGLLRLF